MRYLSISSSFSSNTSLDESILLQESFYVSISGSDLQVKIYGVYKQMRALFYRSHQAKKPLNGHTSEEADIRIHRIIQTLLLTIPIYKEKTMFVTGCKVS